VIQCLKRTLKDSGIAPPALAGVAFSAAMHSLIAVDDGHRPLTASITWADNRAAPWAEVLNRDHNGHGIYRRTGTPIHPMSPLVKILWLRESQPELFARAAKFISIKEYVFHRLFGRYVVDHSIASATGLLNLEHLDWDREALAAAGIDAGRLSALVPTTHVLRGLDAAVVRQTGLDPATPFVVGANDGVLSNLGVNAIAPGSVAVTIGTSGAIRTVIDRPRTDPRGRTFCYALTDRHWVIGGPVNNGGMILRWLRDQLAAAETETARRLGLDPYEILTRIAERVRPGADGLLFHPFLAGERAPYWNADLRGSFFGLALHHRKEHLIRAVLEGIIFNLYGVLLALEELMGAPVRIQATGGFARSALWRQIMADIFNRPVHVPQSFESSCLGAAVLGLYALGRVDSLAVVEGMVGSTHHHDPDPDRVGVYQQLIPIFLALPGRLGDEYAKIAAFQRQTLG
nr:gluconokinase [Pseudomonadota bacterium]